MATDAELFQWPFYKGDIGQNFEKNEKKSVRGARGSKELEGPKDYNHDRFLY